MEATKSHLSAQKYGYDFVASTSQRSLAALMLQSMTEADIEGAWYFFRNNRDEYDICAKEEALKKTRGIDPLDDEQCPDAMSTDEPNYMVLYDAGFIFACSYTLGLPSGVTGDKLPQPCIVLCDKIDKIVLNVYFSEITIVQARNDSGTQFWNRVSQQRGIPWYISTKLNIAKEPLSSIDDNTYFKRHRDLAEEIERRVRQGGNSTPAFEQVVLSWGDFEVTHTETPGTPTGTTGNVRSALGYAARKVEGSGLAPICVLAKAGSSDGVPLITSCDWQVTPYHGDSGVSTLDILCMIGAHHLPGRPHPDFDWHWMQPGDMEKKVHGVTSINGRVIADILRATCWEDMAKIVCAVFKCYLEPDGSMFIARSASAPDAAHVQLCPSEGHILCVKYDTSDEMSYGGTKLQVYYSYTLEIICNQKSITASKRASSDITVTYNAVPSKGKLSAYNEDIYELSVDSKGDLNAQWKTGQSPLPEMAFDPDSSWPDSVQNAASGCVGGFFSDFKESIGVKTGQTMSLSYLNSFIFPGGQVYSFKDPKMSDYNDLLCGLIYKPPKALCVRSSENSSQNDTDDTALPKSKMLLSFSSDYMQNYIPGEAIDLVGNTSRFTALQAKNGNSLVLAIDTSGTLNIVQEQSGLMAQANGAKEVCKLGWLLSSLSPKETTVVTFDAAQNAITGAISLAMVAESGGKEVLFVSLRNSNQELSWIKNPNWERIEFDAHSTAPLKLHVAGIFFAEASAGEYLIVDMDRPENLSSYIERYYVNPSPDSGKRHWEVHDVPGDFSRVGYHSCVGRVEGKHELVDGIYTSGVQGASAARTMQLSYQAIESPYDPTIIPTAQWLFLPSTDESLSSLPIATIRHASSSLNQKLLPSTDLYAVASSKLYRWDAAEQRDGALAKVLMEDKRLLSGTHTLLGMAQDGIAILWGLNSSNQLYTMSCEMAYVSDPSKWSAPFPVALGIERLSAYVNAVDGGNTIFAYAGENTPLTAGHSRLIRLTKESGGSRLWKSQSIILPLPPGKPSTPIMSYTTSISVTDTSGHSVSAAQVSISTISRTAVYINGAYHILSNEASHVKTDGSGTVTVVEATGTLSAASLTVQLEGDVEGTEIKPYADTYSKVRKLDHRSLLDAMVPDSDHIKAGGILETAQFHKLIPPETTDDEVKAAGATFANFNKMLPEGAYTSASSIVQPNRVTPAYRHPSTLLAMGDGNGFWSDIGDFFHSVGEAIKHGIQVAIQWVYHTAEKVYKVAAEILGEAYQAVVKTIGDVVAGVTYVFNQVVRTVEDVYHYLQCLFDWSDIKRTKNVFHKTIRLWLDHQVHEIPKAREFIDEHIETMVKAVDDWSGISHDWDQLGAVAKRSAKDSSKNPADGQTSKSSLLLKHFQNHFEEITPKNTEPWPQIPESAIQEAVAVLGTQEADSSIKDVYDQLCELARSFKDLSVGEILKRLVGILTGAILRAAKAVIDMVLGILSKIAEQAVKLLDTEIHIPVISDILHALGVEGISFLDLFTWIAAVAYTVGYKLTHKNTPPFTKAFADTITSASVWDDFVNLFPRTGTTHLVTDAMSIDLAAMFHGGHAGAGLAGIASAVLHTAEAAMPAKTSTAISYLSIAASVTSAGLTGVTNFVLPRCSIRNESISHLSTFQTAWTIGWALAFGAGGDKLAKQAATTTGIPFLDGRAAGAVVQAALTIPAYIVLGYHFYELSLDPKGSERDEAIIGEVSSLTGAISKLAYAIAVNIPDDEDPVKLVALGVIAVSDISTAGLQIAEASLHY